MRDPSRIQLRHREQVIEIPILNALVFQPFKVGKRSVDPPPSESIPGVNIA